MRDMGVRIKVASNKLLFLVRIFGLIQLVIGLIALYYGPLEIYCFYLFSKGGSLYYEEFGVGSFMFAFLVVQNLAYYLLAFSLIPMGIGTLRLREWGRQVSMVFLFVWIILGISIFIGFVFALPRFLEDTNAPAVGAIAFIIVLFGIIAPYVLIRFYKARSIRDLFRKEEAGQALSKIPSTILLVTMLNILFIILLHISIFFKGIFPVFGEFRFHREGVPLISGAIFCLSIIAYLYYRKHIWALRGLVAYYSLMLVSVVMTFGKYSISDIIRLLDYPQYEYDNVISVFSVFENFNLTLFLASVIIITIWAILSSRKELH